MIRSDATSGRIASLDQFRGYTVLGMFLVNFVGASLVIPAIFKHHHTYCSYADTIMPQFFFAVGFAYRLTLTKRLATGDRHGAYWKVVRRNLALILLAFVVYPLGEGFNSWTSIAASGLSQVLVREFKRNLFQTLTHIAVTSLWVLPVMAARPKIRVAFAAGSALLHLFLSCKFNYTWVNNEPPGIDGGPLSFLAWTLPLLAGSLAHDVWIRGPYSAIKRCLAWGVILMLAGYGLSCLVLAPASHPNSAHGLNVRPADPPFVYTPRKPPDNNLFTMSQRSGSISYLIFAAGFSLVIYAVFILITDVGGLELPILRTLGTNALAGYILHDLVGNAVRPFVPDDAPLWFMLPATVVYLVICWLFLRHLEKERLFLRL
jgi:predicted acyltransferase